MFGSRFLVGVALACGALAPAADPPAKAPDDADAVAAVRKAAEKADVHVIGVSSPAISHFQEQDVTDWPKLALALREHTSAPARVVWNCLPEKIGELLTDKAVLEELQNAGSVRPTERVRTLRTGVRNTLNDIIFNRSDLYQVDAFKDFALEDGTKALIDLGHKRTAWQTSRMNWELLATIFPDSVAPVPPRLMTVRIEVRGGNDTALVLSSSGACRWEVDVKPGSKVTGIVLCGGRAQEVHVRDNSVKAPVVYRARDNPDGMPRDGRANSFGGYDDKHKDWPKFVAGVKETTGKALDSFQGVGTPKPKDGPFVVPPKAK